MARRATIQLKVHRQIVQSIPLDEAERRLLGSRLRLVSPCAPRIDRLIDLLEGELAHSCAHGSGPHSIKVCIIKKGNSKRAYALAEQACRENEERRRRLQITERRRGVTRVRDVGV